MEKRITTIYLPTELIDYIKTNNINLSKFITQALYEHSGTKENKYEQIQNEIKELHTQLSIKQAIFEELKQKKEQKKREKAEKIAEIKQKELECANCGSILREHELNNYGGYCRSCYWGKGYRKILQKQDNKDGGV